MAEEAEKSAAKPAAKKETAAKPAAKSSTSKSTASTSGAAAKSTAAKSVTAKSGTASKSASASKSTASKSGTTASKAAAPKSETEKPAAKKADVASRPSVLKAHHLRPAAGAKKARTRVGRGEGSKGKTAGRGTKGTKARYQVRVGLEGGNLNSVMRAPKLRGFKNPFRTEYQVVNLDRLQELYPKGGEVTIADLVAKGAVRKNEKVKVLGNGELSVKLDVAVDKVSSSAEQKIVAAGGSIK